LADIPWSGIGRLLLTARMGPATHADRAAWKSLVADAAPKIARASLQAIVPRLAARDEQTSPFVRMMSIYDGKDFTFVATLDDRGDRLEQPEFKASWHGYLRLFQLLRAVPHAWFMTHQGSEVGEKYTPIWLMQQVPDDDGWPSLPDVEEPFRALARRLVDAGAPEPQLGVELPDARGDTWAEAEMLWEDARVAVTSHEYTRDARRKPDPTWTVLYIEDLADDPTPVLEALKQTEAN